MDTMLSTSEAARAAGVSEQTIRVWMRTGRLSAQQTPLGALIDPVALGRVIAVREAAQRETQARRGRVAVG